MSDEFKKGLLDTLRKSYSSFISDISSLPGELTYKQQALIRFEEGHMWLQNAIVLNIPVEKKKEEPVKEIDNK